MSDGRGSDAMLSRGLKMERLAGYKMANYLLTYNGTMGREVRVGDCEEPINTRLAGHVILTTRDTWRRVAEVGIKLNR